MDKVDFKKELKQLYNPSAKEVSLVEVPDMNFLMIDGEGAPASQQYIDAVQTLYPLAYTLKFMVKKGKGVDYTVAPLEGLWWVDDMSKFSAERKDEWKWTAMIMQPKYVTEADVKEAIEQVRKKNLPAIDRVRFECYHEGKAAQIMHIGPYSAEADNIQKIHAAIKAGGHMLSGKHHEIYISNPQKTAPEKLKTVIRQPMK
jgi:Uncharacterized conserved protein